MSIVGVLPFIFSNATIADANQVNADFASIVNDVNNNAVQRTGAAVNFIASTPVTTTIPSGGGIGTHANPLTANQVLTGAGTDGMQVTPVTIDSTSGAIAGYKAAYNGQGGTTYTAVTGDTGKVIQFSSGSAVTMTLPNNMPVGWLAEVHQLGAGQVTFSAASGATLNNRQGQSKIAGQYGVAVLKVVSNAGGSSAVYVLAGDTA